MEKINFHHQPVAPLIPTQLRPQDVRPTDASGQEKVSDFKQIFDLTTANIQFSKHANARLSNRNINLSSEQLERLEKGIDNATKKGIRDGLVLVDNIAMVVNMPSRTVITAMNQTEPQEQRNVFTNIDGAVIA